MRHQMGRIHNHIHVNHNQFHNTSLIIPHTFQNTMMSTFPMYTSCIKKTQFSILFTPGVFHICPHASGHDAVFGGKTDPGTAWVRLSVLVFQSPSTVTIACKNDRREFKNNGDNLQQTLHSKKPRSPSKHLQIFAKGIESRRPHVGLTSSFFL